MEEKIWAVKDGYLVLRDGSIFRLNWCRTGKMRKVKQWQTKGGYLYFNYNGKKTYSHRFIASCFLPNPNNLPEVNHKNEIKTDNCVDNLEWCNRSYNVNYGTAQQRRAKKRSKKVYQYTQDGVLVKEWSSAKEIERVLGFHQSNISACCNGKIKSYKGSIWKHACSNQSETSLQIPQ